MSTLYPEEGKVYVRRRNYDVVSTLYLEEGKVYATKVNSVIWQVHCIKKIGRSAVLRINLYVISTSSKD